MNVNNEVPRMIKKYNIQQFHKKQDHSNVKMYIVHVSYFIHYEENQGIEIFRLFISDQ